MKYETTRGDINEEFELLPELLEFEPEFQFEEVISPISNYIKWIQSSLNRIMGLRLIVDGNIDPVTRSAIRSFQKMNGLTDYGIIGPETETLLIQLLSRMSPSSNKEYEWQQMIIPVLGLGVGLFNAGKPYETGDDKFKVNSFIGTNYFHEKTNSKRPFKNAEVDFRIIATHPRKGFKPQNFWFKLTYEYNGNDIRNAGIIELVDRSSALIWSKFTINFKVDMNCPKTAAIYEIVYNIDGRWDPIGVGDVKFWGQLTVKADGSVMLNII